MCAKQVFIDKTKVTTIKGMCGCKNCYYYAYTLLIRCKYSYHYRYKADSLFLSISSMTLNHYFLLAFSNESFMVNTTVSRDISLFAIMEAVIRTFIVTDS